MVTVGWSLPLRVSVVENQNEVQVEGEALAMVYLKALMMWGDDNYKECEFVFSSLENLK